MEAPPSLVPKYLREEDGLSNECRELLFTLPREKGWVNDNLYLYEGFWYRPWHLQGLLRCQKHFQAQNKDTILVTSPKSGTTWLKAMAYALLNRSRFNLSHDHPLLTTNPHDLVPPLEIELYCDTDKVPDLSSVASPRIFSTHIPIGSLPKSVEDSSCKIVYMCRNPKDMFVSMWHFYNKLMPEEKGANNLDDMFDKFCGGKSPFGPAWEHVLGYWKESLENPRKVLFLKYEEIREQPVSHLRRLAEFLECPFSEEEERRGIVDDILRLCSFDHLRNLEVNKNGKVSFGHPNNVFFRKGEVGDWANFLTLEMTERIDRITKLKLGDSQLKF